MVTLFNETLDLLRRLESYPACNGDLVGSAGRLAGMARALKLLGGWPDAETRERYLPRIKAQVARAGDYEGVLVKSLRTVVHGCGGAPCPDCDGPRDGPAT
jgi:hypothetical protein